MSKEYIEQWFVPSFSSDKEYTVSLTEDGKFECSCPDWVYRGQETGRDCKHIRAVVATERQLNYEMA